MVFKLIPENELTELPPPSWLIDGAMETGFVVLDWALSIARGLPYQGQPVNRMTRARA